MKTPSFWYRCDRGLAALALTPVTLVWRFVAALKSLTTWSYQPTIPVVVIGNLTAGGTGKTPLVATLAAEASKKGRKPVILMRGHGGNITAPHRVTADDSAHRVGDEAVWLQRFSPVVIALDRGAGARFITETIDQCDLIIMDDGLQNSSIQPSLRIAVFNGALGIGNGLVIPAGPLRQPLQEGLLMIDAAVITGVDEVSDQLRAKGYRGAIFTSRRHLNQRDLEAIAGKPVFAFAGICHPDGFYSMLRDAGITLTGTRSFSDHHPYTAAELMAMAKKAQVDGAMLVTTGKDYFRLNAVERQPVTVIGLETSLDGGLLNMIMKVRV